MISCNEVTQRFSFVNLPCETVFLADGLRHRAESSLMFAAD
jgi:hypothetical protein